MSPPWAELLRVELGARELRVARWRRGLRRRLAGQATAPLAARADAAAALAGALAGCGPAAAGAQAQIVVAGEWVRLALGRAARLRGAREYEAAASHALRRVYGDAVDQWHIGAARAGPDALLAAGIDRRLFDALRDVLQAAGARTVSCVPLFAAAWNQLRASITTPGWFVLAEPTRATLAFADADALRSIRSHRAEGVELAAELPRWLDQCRLQDGIEADPAAPVLLATSGPAPAGLQDLGLPLRVVELAGATATSAATSTTTSAATAADAVTAPPKARRA